MRNPLLKMSIIIIDYDNDLIYQDADIPNQSVIHAVRGGCWSARQTRGTATPLSKVCLDTVGEEMEEEAAENGTDGGNIFLL